MEIGSSDHDLCSRKESTATIVPSDFRTARYSNHWDKNANNHGDINSDYILPSSPLSSNLVKLYLTKIATDEDESDERVDTNESENQEVTILSAPNITSMSIPVDQIMRTRRQQQKRHRKQNQNQNIDSLVNEYISNSRMAWTDFSGYSSSASDSEFWPKRCGHISDDSFKIRPDKLSTNQLKNRGNEKFPIDFSDIRRARSGINLSHTEHHHQPNKPKNTINSGMLTVPNSLDVHYSSKNKCSISNSNLTDLFKSDSLTVKDHFYQSTPSLSNRSTNDRLIGDKDLKDGLLDMWENFKQKSFKNLTQPDCDKYIYMDDKTLERRIEGQATNLILPVSF